MIDYFNFEEIRPYNKEEFAAAWNRIKGNEMFHAALSFLFDADEKNKLISEFPDFESTRDFQLKIMHRAIRNIIAKSSNGLSSSGFENCLPQQSYTFISNHRDIFLDSGILQILLVEHGHDTSEITFGSNLMLNQFIIDIGKVNKMFTVHRTGNRREMYDNSIRLSNYMRFAVTEKKQSTWIAQRNGRTKNGSDETQMGLLKMLHASKPHNFETSFRELNIIPVAISYEYEPCDVFKVQEIYASQDSNYVKIPGEDLKSIVAGVTEPKGRIHLALGNPINNSITEIANSGDSFKNLLQFMDAEIYANYKLFPGNYIAFDLLHSANPVNANYSLDEKEYFMQTMNLKLSLLKGEKEILKKLFLEIYANPVVNSFKHAKLQS